MGGGGQNAVLLLGYTPSFVSTSSFRLPPSKPRVITPNSVAWMGNPVFGFLLLGLLFILLPLCEKRMAQGQCRLALSSLHPPSSFVRLLFKPCLYVCTIIRIHYELLVLAYLKFENSRPFIFFPTWTPITPALSIMPHGRMDHVFNNIVTLLWIGLVSAFQFWPGNAETQNNKYNFLQRGHKCKKIMMF